VGTERDLLEDADADLVAARGPHHLLEVLVLVRHRFEVGDLPRLPRVRELALPHAVTPLGVHVADALHAEADERLEVDVLAPAVGVDERDASVPGAARPGEVVDVVLDVGEQLGSGVLRARAVRGRRVDRQHRTVGVPAVPVGVLEHAVVRTGRPSAAAPEEERLGRAGGWGEAGVGDADASHAPAAVLGARARRVDGDRRAVVADLALHLPNCRSG
jgi:hypothetical protein